MNPTNKNRLQIPHVEKYLTKLLPRLEEKRVQSFTTLVFSLITLSFFGIFAISPTLSTIADLQKQISDDNFITTQLERKITNLSLLEDLYKKIQGDLPVLYAAIPSTPDVTVLVGQLQTIAQQSGVTLLHIQTLSVDVSNSQLSQYNAYTFALDISGSYNNIQSFLKMLTGFNRLLTIDTISLTNAKGTDVYTVSIRGKAYFKTGQ